MCGQPDRSVEVQALASALRSDFDRRGVRGLGPDINGLRKCLFYGTVAGSKRADWRYGYFVRFGGWVRKLHLPMDARWYRRPRGVPTRA